MRHWRTVIIPVKAGTFRNETGPLAARGLSFRRGADEESGPDQLPPDQVTPDFIRPRANIVELGVA